MGSVAKLFVAQMQDYLGLGRGHTMNNPGTQSGNWQWRMLKGETSDKLAARIRLSPVPASSSWFILVEVLQDLFYV